MKINSENVQELSRKNSKQNKLGVMLGGGGVIFTIISLVAALIEDFSIYWSCCLCFGLLMMIIGIILAEVTTRRKE